MFETHERILQMLGESGHKEFSAETIKGIIDKVEGEEIDKMYAQWLREEEAHAKERAQWVADEIAIDRIERSQLEDESEPVSWAEAAEDLGEVHYPELSQDRELEL